jgi:hypothetical protein
MAREFLPRILPPEKKSASAFTQEQSKAARKPRTCRHSLDERLTAINLTFYFSSELCLGISTEYLYQFSMENSEYLKGVAET